MAIISSAIKVGQKPPEDVIRRVKEAAKHPIIYTEDCPELTDEQLAEFRSANYGTWEERAQAMREKGLIDPEIEEPKAVELPVGAAID